MTALKQSFFTFITFVAFIVTTILVLEILISTKTTSLKGNVHFDVKVEKTSSNVPALWPHSDTVLQKRYTRRSNTTTSALPSIPHPDQMATLSRAMARREHFFDNELLKSTDQILKSKWVTRLKAMLGSSGAGKHVSVVFGNYPFLESILNWLIAAKVNLKPPLENVIVFCLDEKLFQVLDKREIPAIYIDHKTVIGYTAANDFKVTYIFIMRMVVYRLINHFGYDVTAYDSDAILIRNPQELWEKHQYSDIVSSPGKFPHPLGVKWGFTLCMGVILFRSTPKTELLWESISSNITDDQILLNTAIKDCQVKWKSKERNIRKDFINGQCATGLKITVLSRSDICRQCLSHTYAGDVYIWHQHPRVRQSSLSKSERAKAKAEVAKKGESKWFLRSDWESKMSGDQKGTKWLHSLSVSKGT